MTLTDHHKQARQAMDKAVEAVRREFSTVRTGKATTGPQRKVIAVGKRVDGRWQVRTSLWRYVVATALSSQ